MDEFRESLLRETAGSDGNLTEDKRELVSATAVDNAHVEKAVNYASFDAGAKVGIMFSILLLIIQYWFSGA